MASKKAIYKITKTFSSGERIYYIKIHQDSMSQELLESIGDHTDGGHSNGYNIRARKVPKLPAGVKLLQRSHNIY